VAVWIRQLYGKRLSAKLHKEAKDVLGQGRLIIWSGLTSNKVKGLKRKERKEVIRSQFLLTKACCDLGLVLKDKANL